MAIMMVSPEIAKTLNVYADTFIPDKRTTSSLLPMAIMILPKMLHFNKTAVRANVIRKSKAGSGKPKKLLDFSYITT